jgi:mannose-6-phosphate isomerase-like protein (cupin superfamily)
LAELIAVTSSQVSGASQYPRLEDNEVVLKMKEPFMSVLEGLLEIREYTGVGYQPVVDYGAWRIAILRYIDELLPQNIGKMQRHNQTDEVFVLLAGHCILFIGEGDDQIASIYAQDMEPQKLYNVKQGCWHTHTLSEDATVLLVENRDTGNENSPEIVLDVSQRDKIVELTRPTWE